VPDLDAIGRPFGLGDLSFLGGHRALTHSLPFAVVLGVAVAWFAFRRSAAPDSLARIAVYLVLATASHGILDAFASYGEGLAFLYPLSTTRYAAPWRPFDALNEIWWIWLPASLFILGVRQLRRSQAASTRAAA
jgi:inner membrane protein